MVRSVHTSDAVDDGSREMYWPKGHDEPSAKGIITEGRVGGVHHTVHESSKHEVCTESVAIGEACISFISIDGVESLPKVVSRLRSQRGPTNIEAAGTHGYDRIGYAALKKARCGHVKKVEEDCRVEGLRGRTERQ